MGCKILKRINEGVCKNFFFPEVLNVLVSITKMLSFVTLVLNVFKILERQPLSPASNKVIVGDSESPTMTRNRKHPQVYVQS